MARLKIKRGAGKQWVEGKTFRLAEEVRYIQRRAALYDARMVTLGQLLDYLDEHPWQFPQDSEWLNSVQTNARENQELVAGMVGNDGDPIGYYTSLMAVKETAPRDVVYVTEGEGTMAIARTVLDTFYPRHRLDAGTYGSMGLGHGFAIAAAVTGSSAMLSEGIRSLVDTGNGGLMLLGCAGAVSQRMRSIRLDTEKSFTFGH